MNILYVVENFPKMSETWIRNEIRELRRRGNRVAVFSHDSPDEVPNDLKDIPHCCAPPPTPQSLIRTNLSEFIEPSLYEHLFWTKNPLRQAYVIYYAVRACEFISSLQFDIDHVHGHFAGTPQISANYVSNVLGVCHTLMVHSHDLYVYDHKPTKQFLYKNVDRFIAPSEYNKSYMVKNEKITAPIDVIPACFDSDEFTPDREIVDNRLLSVARHVEKKGLRYAIEAVGQLNEEVEYHITSDGPLTDELKDLARDHGVSQQIQFLGRVSETEIRREFDEAELFVLPCVIANNGDRDIIPVSIKEAMAMETPVITTDVSGIPELLNDEVGWMIEPRNSDQLSNVISEALNTDTKQMGTRARKLVQSHSPEVIVPELLNSFERSINK